MVQKVTYRANFLVFMSAIFFFPFIYLFFLLTLALRWQVLMGVLFVHSELIWLKGSCLNLSEVLWLRTYISAVTVSTFHTVSDLCKSIKCHQFSKCFFFLFWFLLMWAVIVICLNIIDTPVFMEASDGLIFLFSFFFFCSFYCCEGHSTRVGLNSRAVLQSWQMSKLCSFPPLGYSICWQLVTLPDSCIQFMVSY